MAAGAFALYLQPGVDTSIVVTVNTTTFVPCDAHVRLGLGSGDSRCPALELREGHRVRKVESHWLSGSCVACACSIFLIDHAWTCRVEHARKQLQQVPGLLHRMANLMGIEFHGEVPSPEVVALVLEEMWKFNQTYQLAHGVSRLTFSQCW